MQLFYLLGIIKKKYLKKKSYLPKKVSALLMLNYKKVLSLFTGCGGMDLGFEGNFEVIKESINLKKNKNQIKKRSRNGFVLLNPTSFKNVFANDIRPGAQICWENYFLEKHKRKYGVLPRFNMISGSSKYVLEGNETKEAA